jgi:hypothetical protein
MTDIDNAAPRRTMAKHPGWDHDGPNIEWLEETYGAAFWLAYEYRLCDDDVATIYVSEPDAMDGGDLEQLLALHRAGWFICIDGNGERHPTTLRVLISRSFEG